jgi:hypothetical protein
VPTAWVERPANSFAPRLERDDQNARFSLTAETNDQVLGIREGGLWRKSASRPDLHVLPLVDHR